MAGDSELQTLRKVISSSHTSQTRKPSRAHVADDSSEQPLVIAEDAVENGDLVAVANANASSHSIAIVVSIAAVTGTSSLLNGLVTVILPTLEKDLPLGPALLVW